MLLLLLACSDKDGDTAVSDDTSVVDDTAADDTAQEACVVSDQDAVTFPVDGDSSATFTVDGEVTSVSLEDEELDFTQSGTAVAVQFRVKRPGSYFLSFQVAGKSPCDAQVRGHNTDVTFEAPDGLVPLEETGTLLWTHEKGVAVLTGEEIVEMDLDGKVTNRWIHKFHDLGDATCKPAHPIAVCGDSENISWAGVNVAPETRSLEGTTLIDMAPYGDAVRYIVQKPEDAGPDSSGGGFVAIDGKAGKTWDLGQFKGDVRLLGDTFVVAACGKNDTVTLDERSFEGGKEVSFYETGVTCDSWTDWGALRGDLNDGGDFGDEELFTFPDPDGMTLVVRLEDGTVVEDHWDGVEALTVNRRKWNRVCRRYPTRQTTCGRLVVDAEASTISFENPVFVGDYGQNTNLLAGIRPGGGITVLTGSEAMYMRRGGWQLATDGDGGQLIRTVDDDGVVGFTYDGAQVGGSGSASMFTIGGGNVIFADDSVLTISGGDFQVDGGSFFDVTTTPGGTTWAGVALGDQVGLVPFDPTDPSKDAFAKPIVIGLNTTKDQAPATLDAVLDSEDISARVTTDTGCAIVRVSPDGQIETLAEGDCDQVPAVVGAFDPMGDGGGLLLGDGRLLGPDVYLDRLTIEPVGGRWHLGDFNEDGLDDVCDAEVCFYSDGMGGWLQDEQDAPDWLAWSRQTTVTPDTLSPVRLFSWGLVLD